MRTTKLLAIIVLVFYSSLSIAQEETKKGGLELGINITSVLSSFSGNGSFLEASDFPISLRLRRKKSILRFGLGATSTSNEFFDNITFSFRESKATEIFVRVGFERNVPIDKKWTFYWGLDAISSLELDIVEIFNFNDNRIRDRNIGLGGGLLSGIKYYINDRLYLSTEATFYGLFKFKEREESGINFNVVRTTSSEFALQPPLFIYLNYSF